MSSNLILHCGARQVDLTELAQIETPKPVGRWYPIPHIDVLEKVKETLLVAGFAIRREQHSLTRGGARYFSILDLADYLHEGVSLTVGIRNSFDKSFPIGFCAGNRVFVCDNLSFSSELLVSRKHTVTDASDSRPTSARRSKGSRASRRWRPKESRRCPARSSRPMRRTA